MVLFCIISIKMFRKIIRFFEKTDWYSIIKDFESIIFHTKATGPVKITDPHAYLKNYSLEVIKGIGPKIKMKLENSGINSPYDLINCQSIQGFSESRISTWKQCALALD